MHRKRRKIAMFVAILLAAILLIPMIISAVASLMIPGASAITQKEIDAMKQSLGSISSEKKRLKDEISSLKSDKNAVMDLIRAYDDQIALTSLAIEESALLISHLNEAIAAQQLTLDEATQKVKASEERFTRRLQAMDRMEEVSYVGVLLEAQSFTDLLSRWDDITEIMSYDRKIIDELSAERDRIDAIRMDLDAQKQEYIQYRETLTEAEIEYAELRDAQNELYETMNREEEYLEILLREQEEDERKQDKKIAEAQEALRKQEEEAKRKREYSGQMSWPVPGHTRISSPFGKRTAPTKGASTNHKGLDIPAPAGAPIVAANTGIVLVKVYSSSYGNYVVIDHGGGVATLYAHMSKFANIQVGSTIKKGETLGYSGSTGISTGPHLHFEVIKDGVKVDPKTYVIG